METNRDEDERRPRRRFKLRGDCWVCYGTGRVTKHGCTKTVACGECGGDGGSKLPGLMRQIEEEAADVSTL